MSLCHADSNAPVFGTLWVEVRSQDFYNCEVKKKISLELVIWSNWVATFLNEDLSLQLKVSVEVCPKLIILNRNVGQKESFHRITD